MRDPVLIPTPSGHAASRTAPEGQRSTLGARIAVVHEWIDRRAGSEQVFERIAALLPAADLFTLTRSAATDLDLGSRSLRVSRLDTPWLRRHRPLTLAAMPAVWHYLSRSQYDIVISSTHAFGRYFGPARSALHLNYCHVPMRYVWDPALDRRGSSLARFGGPLLRPPLRWLDRRSVRWTDSIAANSLETARRIRQYYGREAEVIYPPVDVEFFRRVVPMQQRRYLLAVSRFVEYKRLDIAIDASAAVGIPLVVAGGGPLEDRLRLQAAAAHPGGVEFVIQPSASELRDLYAGAAALVFPAVEDFGMVAVEAQAAGTPVVAMRIGGTAESVIDGRTGVLVDQQTPRAFIEGIQRVLEQGPSSDQCRRNAIRFSQSEFDRCFLDWLWAVVEEPTTPLAAGTQ